MPPPTSLLDLPNELLLEILSHALPRPCIAPCTLPQPRATNIAFTCKRLFHLVQRRLSTLDFLTPATAFTHVTRVPTPSVETVEALANLSAPFLRVLRLPAEFRPSYSDMSSMPCCNQLRELFLPINYDITPAGAEKFLVQLKKLVSLTLTNPRTPVLQVLTVPSWRLEQLSLITVSATRENLSILENILDMASLQSLTITFDCSGEEPVINQYNCDEPDRIISYPETLEALSGVLRKKSASLRDLRSVCVATSDRGPRSRSLRGDGENVKNMVREINALRDIIDDVREEAVHNTAYLNLTRLQVDLWTGGEVANQNFMKGLLNTSTEAVVVFENLTVSYPGTLEGAVPRAPVVTDLKFFFEEEHWALTKDLKFEQTSISIVRKESARMLANELAHPFLSVALPESVDSIRVEYLIPTAQELRDMLKALHYISCFTLDVKLLSLPVSIIAKSDLITLADWMNIKCAPNVRTLCLDFNNSKTFQPDPLGTLFLDDATIEFFRKHAELVVEHLPDFLQKVRQAFPKLTHLYMEKSQMMLRVAAKKIRRLEDVVRLFERDSGIDASSVLLEIGCWAIKERPINFDMELLNSALEKLDAYQAARARALRCRTWGDESGVGGFGAQ